GDQLIVMRGLNIFEADAAAVAALNRLDADLDRALVLVLTGLYQALAAGDDARQHLHVVERGPYLIARRIDRVAARDLQTPLLSVQQREADRICDTTLCYRSDRDRIRAHESR